MASEHAFSKGSVLPPLSPGLLRLYSMRFCPFAQRTRLILNYLKVPHEIVNVDLRHKPEWLFEKNPFGLVPIIELDDKIIYESHICDEFLDEVYGDSKLLTKDPYKKAQQKIILEHFAKTIPSYYGVQSAVKPDEIKSQVGILEDKLKFFENTLSGKFFGGDVPNFVDFSIWPWFERLPIFSKYKGIDVLERKSRFPKLLAWISEMESLPAVKASYVPLEDAVEFMKQFYNPFFTKPNFDIGLKE